MALQGCALARLGVPVARFSTSFLPLPFALPPSRSQLVVCWDGGGGKPVAQLHSPNWFCSGNGGGLFSDCFCELILSLLWGGVVARPGTPLFSRVVVLFCWILLSSFGIWIRFAGADCHLLLASGYVSVGVYLQSQRDLFLKPKVRRTGSGSAALRLRRLAGLCLPRFRPISGSGSLSDLPRGCEILKNCLISSVLPCRVLYVLTLSLSER